MILRSTTHRLVRGVRPRGLVFAALVLVWGLLLSRLGPHVPQGGTADRSTAVAPDAPGAQHAIESGYRLGIYHGVERVGSSSLSIRAEGDGFRLNHETRLRLTVLAERRDIRTRISAKLATDFSVLSSVQRIESEGADFRGSVHREGDVLHYEAGFAGERSRGRIELEPGSPLHLPVTVRLAVAKRLEAGREIAFDVFDPMTLRVTPMVVRVVGREALPHDAGHFAWKVDENLRGMMSSAWLDETGRVWAEAAMMGFHARADEDGPPVGERSLAALDVERATGVPVGEIADPRARDELVLEVKGIPRERIATSAAQRLVGERLVLRRVSLESVGSYRLPAAADDGYGAYLEPETWLQSDHPRIRALAAEILAGERDALLATQLLVRWVYAYLEKVPTLSLPNALAVLDGGRGDCNEHAALFTALARAAGLPSRVVAGLVYVDGSFVYHAWSEVRGARDWLPVDPALGQVPADATHIALAYGELWDLSQLADVVGVIRLEPLAD